jgi:hypothetical protein
LIGSTTVGLKKAVAIAVQNVSGRRQWSKLDDGWQTLRYSQAAKVKMVGVWDTVGSVGVAAGNIPGISRSQFSYLQTGLYLPIENGYHALAIDEHRSDFAPTL